jgi:hypothetical protein
MSEEAKRDNSGVPVGLGSDGVGGTKQLRVDPATNRLLIDIAVLPDVDPPTFPITAPRDNSNNPVGMAVTDNAAKTPRPLLIDSRNGYLFCDIIIE